MARALAPISRPLSALLLLALLLGLATFAPGAPARAEGFEATVLRGDFDDLPAGALGAAPVALDAGTLRAAPAPVEVATAAGLEGQALTVTGAGAAELRFSTYPGPLPQAANSQRYELRVRANLVAPAASAKGASLYLATAGGQRFEIVGFGADGKLARAGAALNLAYAAGGRVRVDARFDLKNGELRLDLSTGSGSLTLEGITLPGSFSPDTVAALVFAAGGATGAYGIDAVDAKVQKEEGEDKPPPARIEISQPGSAAPPVVEVVNNVTLISFNIVIKNSGGRAAGSTLYLDIDDDLLELLDLSWVSGIGYVKEIKDGQIVIGVGQYNVVRKGTYDLKFKFKLKERKDGELKLDIKYRLRYSDSGGVRETQPIVIVVIVPPPGTIPTSTPATATPTTTGTPATATPTTTGTPATPTTTGTPATATPSPVPPSPTPTAGS